MKPAISRWNQRFLSTEDYVFGKAPNAFMVRHATPLIRPGATALAVADGEGRNGAWLAQKGCEVWSMDAAPAASKKAQKLAAELGVDMHVITADATEIDWAERQYDLVVGIFFQFANPQLRAQLFEGMKRATRRGGHVLIEGYGLKQLEYKTGGPDIAEHLYTIDLLRDAFADMEIEVLQEYDAELNEGSGHHGMSAVVDLVARKP